MCLSTWLIGRHVRLPVGVRLRAYRLAPRRHCDDLKALPRQPSFHFGGYADLSALGSPFGCGCLQFLLSSCTDLWGESSRWIG